MIRLRLQGGRQQAAFCFFNVLGFLLCGSSLAVGEEKIQCRLDFLKDGLAVARSPTATAGTLYVSSSPGVAATCRGRVTKVEVLFIASNETLEEDLLLAETSIAMYTPVDTGLERSSDYVQLKPEAGVFSSSDGTIVQATFFLSGDAELEVEQGQTVGVLVGSKSIGPKAQTRATGYPLLIGESEDTQAIGGQSIQALKQLPFISNQQGERSSLPAFSFQIETDSTMVRDMNLSHLKNNTDVGHVTNLPNAVNTSSMPDNSSTPDDVAPQRIPLASILSPIAVIALVAILSAVVICVCYVIWRKCRSSNQLQTKPMPKEHGERAREHTYHEALDTLESGIHLETVESHDDLEESSAGYEVVVQHKELRGTASVFFERSSCYAYVDIDADAVDCGPAPYEVPRKLRGKTEKEEASSHRHIQATGNEAHPKTALDTGGGKESMYINFPFAPPPASVQGLCKTLAKRKCVELPRGALKTVSIVGAGEFGEVYSGVWSSSSHGTQEVAIKILKKNATEEHKIKFLQEAVIMGQFRHPHIIRLLGAVTIREPKMLVLEFMHKGDLLNWLVAQIKKSEICKHQELPRYLLSFCQEIADGMKYLSNKGFIHRDLAARNILLDKNLKCKIADFGMSRNLSGSQVYSTTGANIPVRWSPPEVLREKRFTRKSDVWSYGMVMYEIWSLGSAPYPHTSDLRDVVKLVVGGRRHIQSPPTQCPRAVYDIMVQCWSYIHHNRPPFADILTLLSSVSDSDLKDVA